LSIYRVRYGYGQNLQLGRRDRESHRCEVGEVESVRWLRGFFAPRHEMAAYCSHRRWMRHRRRYYPLLHSLSPIARPSCHKKDNPKTANFGYLARKNSEQVKVDRLGEARKQAVSRPVTSERVSTSLPPLLQAKLDEAATEVLRR